MDFKNFRCYATLFLCTIASNVSTAQSYLDQETIKVNEQAKLIKGLTRFKKSTDTYSEPIENFAKYGSWAEQSIFNAEQGESPPPFPSGLAEAVNTLKEELKKKDKVLKELFEEAKSIQVPDNSILEQNKFSFEELINPCYTIEVVNAFNSDSNLIDEEGLFKLKKIKNEFDYTWASVQAIEQIMSEMQKASEEIVNIFNYSLTLVKNGDMLVDLAVNSGPEITRYASQITSRRKDFDEIYKNKISLLENKKSDFLKGRDEAIKLKLEQGSCENWNEKLQEDNNADNEEKYQEIKDYDSKSDTLNQFEDFLSSALDESVNVSKEKIIRQSEKNNREFSLTIHNVLKKLDSFGVSNSDKSDLIIKYLNNLKRAEIPNRSTNASLENKLNIDCNELLDSGFKDGSYNNKLIPDKNEWLKGCERLKPMAMKYINKEEEGFDVLACVENSANFDSCIN